MSHLASAPLPHAPVVRKKVAPAWWRKTTKYLRRIHLYSGLFLVPWVLLYGITGYLFNHPTHFSDFDPPVQVAPELLAEGGFEQLTDRESLAQSVVDELNRASDLGEVDRFRLVPGSVAEPRGRYVAQRADGVQTHQLRITDDFSSGELRVRSRRREVPLLPIRRAAGLTTDLRESLAASANQVMDRLGIEGGPATITSAPRLAFQVTDREGQDIDVRLDVVRGTITGTRVEPPQPPTVRRLLTRLHTAHGYPDEETEPRWWWAIMVDVMAAAMVLWGGTGLIMWWQIRTLRRIGTWVLVAAALWAAYLTLGMHEAFTT